MYPIDASLAPEACAAAYAASLCGVAGLERPQLDLVLLGMGPDGHTASLFPGHPLLQERGVVASIIDSPKPPPWRVTFTLPTICAAHAVAFIATGASKAPVLRDIFGEGAARSLLPAALVRQSGHELPTWFVDPAAVEFET